MRRHVVTLPCPPDGWEDLAGVVLDARTAVSELDPVGDSIRVTRSVFIPEDESCLLILDCASDELAVEAAHRIGRNGTVVSRHTVRAATRSGGTGTR